MSISILYVHHSGTFGGASRSLLEMINALPAGSVIPHLITPKGNVAEFAARQGIPLIEARGISQFDCTRFGHYRGLRWLVLLRELWLLPFTVTTLLKARSRWKNIQLIHVNELTGLTPIVLGKLLFRRPVVVHVRSVMLKDGIPLRQRLLRHVVRRYVDRIIAIDDTVKANLPAGLTAEVVHNGFATDAPPGAPAILPAVFARKNFRVAMIGNLMPMKGVSEFIEAARLCSGKGLNIDFILVGDNVRRLSGISGWLLQQFGFARDVRGDVEAFVHEHALFERVHLIGFMANIKDVYDRIDVLCFPSHLNAAGRPVFEAAFSRVPSIVAIEEPRADTIVDHETGICIKPGDPRMLADAIEYLYTRSDERERMGNGAYELALRNFDVRTNAARVLDLYRQLVLIH